jgi:hypothetical protein
MRSDLIEKLRSASRYEDAGDLIDPKADLELSLDCYLKANNFIKAIKVCMLNNRADLIAT